MNIQSNSVRELDSLSRFESTSLVHYSTNSLSMTNHLAQHTNLPIILDTPDFSTSYI